jgi:hypothetical protein
MPRRSSGFRRDASAGEAYVDPKATINSELYALIKGRLFGSWIAAGGRSVGHAEGDLIENPAYIIESLLRDENALTNTEINKESIDDIGNTSTGRRSTWKCARSLTEQRSMLDAIDELCQNAGLIFTHDFSNLAKLTAIDHYGPSISLDDSDVVEEAGKPQISVRQSHVKYIRNEFYLNYQFNHATGNYDKQIFVTASSHNLSGNTRSAESPLDTYTGLCDWSQTAYNKTERWTFDAPWIRDAATAELFLKMTADWLCIRKWEIVATLRYSDDTLALEVGDQALWDTDLLPISVRDKQVTDLAGQQDVGGLLANGPYYYVVTALDIQGQGRASNEILVTVTNGEGMNVLNWSELQGASKYRVYRGATSSGESVYWETTDHSFIDSGNVEGTPGTPPAVSPAFFVTNVVDGGISGGCRLQMKFLLCPTVFF